MTRGVEVSDMAGNHRPLFGLRMGCRGKCENCGQQRQAMPTKPVAHETIHVVAPVSHSPSDHATADSGAATPPSCGCSWTRRDGTESNPNLPPFLPGKSKCH